MFDWVDKHKRWIQIGLLFLIVPSFAFFGINYYFDDAGDAGAVAKVAGTRISPAEFDNALRERQEELRQMMKDKVDTSMLDSNEVRNAVINGLVEKRALLAHSLNSGMAVPDAQVQKIIREIPYFQDQATGKFSLARYNELLKSQGMTAVMFEERVRQDLRIAQTRGSVVDSTVLADAVVTKLGKIREQTRVVSQVIFSPEKAVGRVTVTDDEVRKHYDATQKDFRIPERARVEYIVLGPDSLGKAVAVSDDEIREYYDKNKSQYSKPEERKASHILISLGKDADAAAKDKARKQAEDLLAQVKAAPKSFEDLARKFSQDPGSAKSGGSLGFFARGAMVKPFDEAVFAMKAGDLQGPVETQYGFHIIRLDEIKAASETPIEEVKAAIEEQLRKPKIGKAFADMAENFTQTVYEQSDSLKPAAEAFKLKIETSDWITRDGGGDPLLAKPAMLAKIFSEDVIKNKRNTDAIEVESGKLVAARVIEHREASVLPFEDVKSDIAKRLQLVKAAKQMETDGLAALEKARKGDEAGLDWSAPVELSLQRPGTLVAEAARDVFAADPAKLPAFVGVQDANGRYLLYKITKVVEAPDLPPEEKKALAKQIAQVAAQQQWDAYLQAIKASAGVSIDTTKIERKAQQ